MMFEYESGLGIGFESRFRVFWIDADSPGFRFEVPGFQFGLRFEMPEFADHRWKSPWVAHSMQVTSASMRFIFIEVHFCTPVHDTIEYEYFIIINHYYHNDQ